MENIELLPITHTAITITICETTKVGQDSYFQVRHKCDYCRFVYKCKFTVEGHNFYDLIVICRCQELGRMALIDSGLESLKYNICNRCCKKMRERHPHYDLLEDKGEEAKGSDNES